MKTCLMMLALLAALCAPSHADEAPLTILAASSLQDVLNEVEALYEKETGQAVRMAFDGSGVLARQIEKGAPADLFISASRDWMDSLVQQKRVDETTRVTIAGNRLVLVQPAPHDVFVQEPADLLRITHIVMGDPATVPAPPDLTTLPANPQDLPVGGFGLHLIKQLMDDVQFTFDPRQGNRLKMVKRKKAV